MENIRLILILLLISFGVFGMVEEKKEKDNFLLRSNNKNNDNHHNQNNNPDNNTIYIINKYSNNNNKNNKNKNNISISHSNKFKRHIQCSNNNNILRGLKVLTVPTKPSTSSICYSNKETCCPTETEKQIQQHITTMINNTINKLVQPVYKAVEGTYDLWKAYISDLLSSTGETTERMIVNEFKIQSMHSSISQLIHQFNSSIHQSIHPSVHPFSPELSQTITTFADQLFLNAYFEFIHPGTHSASWNEELKKCILKFRLPNHQFLGTLAFKPSLSQLGLLSQSFHSSLRALIFSIHPSQCQTDLMKMAGCTTCAQQHTCINYCLRVTSNCFRPLLSLQPVWNNFVDAFIKYHQFVGEAPTLPFRLFPLRVFDGVVEFLINSRIIYNTVNTECANYSYPNIKPANLTQLEEKAQKLKEQKKSFFDNSLLALLEDDYNSNIADEDYRHNKVLNDYYNYNFDDNSDDNQDGDEEDEDAEYDNYDYDDEGYIDDDDDPYITDSNEDGVEIEDDDMNYDDEDDVSNYPDDIMKHKKRRKRYAENKNNNNNNNSKNNINSNINMFMKSITSWVWLDVPPGVCHLFIPDSDLDNNNNNNIENRFLNRRKREATYHHRHFGPHDNGLGGGGVGSMRDSGKNKNDDKTDESHNILSMKNFLPLKPTYLKFLPSSSSPSSSSSFSSPSSLSSFYSYLDYYTEFDLNHYRPFFKDAEGCTDDSLFHSQGMHKSTEPSKELLDIASALHNLTHRMVFKFMSPYRPELESGFDNDDEEGDYGQGYEDGSGEYVDEDYIFDGSGDYIYDVEMYDYENETEAEETTTYNGHHHVLSDTPPTTTTSTKTKSSSSSSSSSILPIFFCIIFVMKMFDF